MAVDFTLATVLFLAPLGGHFIEEGAVHAPVELVEIHGVDPVTDPLVFGLKPLDRILMLAPFVGMAGVQGFAHPFEHFVVEVEPAEQIGELLLQHLLAHMAAAAGGGIAPAFIGIAGAVVVDVFLFLDFADDRAATLVTGDEARERKIVSHPSVLIGVAAIERALHPLPQIGRDQRLVLALDELTVPLKHTGVEAAAQDVVHRAYRHFGAALAINEARALRLLRRFLQR